MKKISESLIVAAMTAGIAYSGTAGAEATAYGKIHLSVGSTTSQDTTTGKKYNATQFKSHASRFGIKGKQDLENGMTVIGQVEYEIDAVGDVTSTKNDTHGFLKARNTFFGLKGGFGQVRVGIHDLPKKIAAAKLDPFADTYADYNNVIKGDDRLGNTLIYLNKIGGLEIGASYSAGDDAGKDAATENKNSVTSAMVNYKVGGLFVSLSRANYADALATELENGTKAGLSYSLGDATLGVVYEKDGYKDTKDAAATYASLKWKVTDAGSVNAAYGKYDYEDSAKKDPAFFAVGYNHALDKSASLYLLYTAGTDGGLADKGKLTGDGSAAVVGASYKF